MRTISSKSGGETTASASQIRRPIYDSSVSLWRRYESELSRLKRSSSQPAFAYDYVRRHPTILANCGRAFWAALQKQGYIGS